MADRTKDSNKTESGAGDPASEVIAFQSTRFGAQAVTLDKVFDIIGGIIGFPDLTKYTVLEYTPPFSWLHCVERGDLAFVVVNAAEFGAEYVVPLPVGDRDIDLRQDDDVAIMNLVSVRPDPTMTTVNLKAPVIVNLRNRKGRQIVLDNSRYPVRMPLWVKDDSKEG